MQLHNHPEGFKTFIALVADYLNLPESAIERDYYIVLLLKNLADSEYSQQCVFKGGTSLSKCYPKSIERFSEDIDLTYLGTPEMKDKEYSKNIKKIEKIMTIGAQTEKINSERNDRNKSMYVWFDNKANRIKLEIGSSIRPDPFSKRVLKTYIQEFLEKKHGSDDIERYNLKSIELNVLNIERTFIDKLMSVKRHAYCGTLNNKVRHIYDVTRLYHMQEIQDFLSDKNELKRLMSITKETDSFYLTKRNINRDYDPTGAFNFEIWMHYFTNDIKYIYENLHKDLLYTNSKQNFEDALTAFTEINNILKSIDE